MKDKIKKETKTRDGENLHINVIDILIIVLVVACISGVVVRYTVLDDIWTTQNLDNYYIDFTAGSLTYTQRQAIINAVDETETGENWIYFNDGSTKLGTLTAITAANRDDLTFKDANGILITAKYDDTKPENEAKWIITGKILCQGKYSEENGFLLNGKQYIASNSEYSVQTRDCDFTVKITAVEKSLE